MNSLTATQPAEIKYLIDVLSTHGDRRTRNELAYLAATAEEEGLTPAIALHRRTVRLEQNGTIHFYITWQPGSITWVALTPESSKEEWEEEGDDIDVGYTNTWAVESD